MFAKTLGITAAALTAITLSACATQPHADHAMLQGMHAMPHKGGYMRDKQMPDHSTDCSRKALETMPPEHRAMCEGKAKAPPPAK